LGFGIYFGKFQKICQSSVIYMFLLPNGLKIDEEGLINGLKDTSISHKYYFDILTGQVGLIKESKGVKKIKKLDEKRFFLLPKISKDNKKPWAQEFIEDMVRAEDLLLAEALDKALNIGGFDPFFKILKQSYFVYGWPQWESHYLYEELVNWFDTLPVDIKEEFEFFDDCPVCQAMKKAKEEGRELSEEELFKAFQQSKEQGNIVGGQWFERPDSPIRM